jgi:hypothetical protein
MKKKNRKNERRGRRESKKTKRGGRMKRPCKGEYNYKVGGKRVQGTYEAEGKKKVHLSLY